MIPPRKQPIMWGVSGALLAACTVQVVNSGQITGIGQLTAGLSVPSPTASQSGLPTTPSPSTAAASPSPLPNLPTGTVTGRIVDARTGLGIADATVEAASISPAVQTQTDSDGNYFLGNVPAEQIEITVQKQGYTYPAGEGATTLEVLPNSTINAPDIKLWASQISVPNAFVLSIPDLNHPRAIAIGPQPNASTQALYVINDENWTLPVFNWQQPLSDWGVRKFNLTGGLANTFSSTLMFHSLQNPMGLCVDKGGDVYIADPGSNSILEYSAYGSYIQSPPNSSEFPGINDPYDIKLLSTGQFAVSSAGNNEVMLFDASMGPAHDLAGALIPPITGADGLKGIAVDADDNLYLIDDAAVGDGVIRKVSPQGQVLFQFGFRGGNGEGYFQSPTAIAVDNRNGDIYVVDSGNNRVQRFDRDGAFMSQFGGMGGGNGQFNNPTGIAVDASGDVFISDTNNNRIEEFAPSS